MDKLLTMTSTAPPTSSRQFSKVSGIFDAEIHASVERSAMVARMPEKYRSRCMAGYHAHGYLNFDQRGGGYRRDVESMEAASPEGIRRSVLDRYSTRFALLTGTSYEASIYPDREYCNAFASAYNGALVEDFAEKDKALLASIQLNFNDPPAALREIARWADHPRVAAIITSTASTETPGSRRYDPIFAAAAEAGLVIAYHTTAEGRSLCPPPTSAGYPSRYIEYHSALATGAIGHASSLLTNGVFARYPDLRVLYLEGGIAWALPLMWMLDQDWRRFRDEVPDLKEPPSHYLRHHMYFTTQPIEEPERGDDLLAVYEQVGLDRNIVYSTDFPHWDFDDPEHFLPSCFSQAQRDRILWDNAAALFSSKVGPLLAKEDGK